MDEASQIIEALMEALKREDGPAALALAPEALAISKDRKPLRARVIAWLAQAEMFSGNYKAASQAVRQAMALAAELGDTDGGTQLKSLQAQIAMKRQQAKGLVASPLPIDLPDTPVSRANALLSMGDLVEGERLAREAFALAAEAGDAREQVLALLALARIPARAEEAIFAAHAVADAASDMNLVTAVAKAAGVAGVVIPARVF